MNKHENVFQAISQGDLGKLKSIGNDGFDLNYCSIKDGRTFLQFACQLNRVEAIQVLVELGANPDVKFTIYSKVGGYPLYKDATSLMCVKSREAATLLIKAGAKVEEKDAGGWTPLVWAANSRRLDVIDLLVEGGANMQIKFNYDGILCNLVDFITAKENEILSLAGENPNAAALQMLGDYRKIKEIFRIKGDAG